MAGGESQLRFAPFLSSVDSGFWWKLSQRKLDLYKLDDTPTDVNGFYLYGEQAQIQGRLNIDYTAFDVPWQVPPRSCHSAGVLYSVNTIEAFKELDKRKLLNTLGDSIWASVCNGEALENPSKLNRFLLVTYVDLKKYCFYYWFAFPAVCYPENATLTETPKILDEYLSPEQRSKFEVAYDKFQTTSREHYFLVHITEDYVSFHLLSTFNSLSSQQGKLLLGFIDPCTLPNNPGWPLRNFLALAAYHWQDNVKQVEIICLRERFKEGVREIGHSLVLSVHMVPSPMPQTTPGVVGWETNEKQKKAPRKVNLSTNMDPRKLVESSVDLNLKLMRWRLAPSLDLESIGSARCLLLGSGTLGCNVARLLMGWGVRHITLIDSGLVSFSNPVRQSLFNFEDCLNGGKSKSEAAASALQRIFPGVNAVGVNLAIPMPGHFVTENSIDAVRDEVTKLAELIENHDVIYLLTDTRESRWLPTVIAASRSKVVINAALGFDTFLVMRHGIGGGSTSQADQPAGLTSEPVVKTKYLSLRGTELGCYFCNDVVAPGDSTQNRTMDQQCTVTRPGVSMIAAALAVELMVSILQHPERGLAAADASNHEDLACDTDTTLGIIPHQIRGFLSRFYHILPVCRRFEKCTACSSMVLDEYIREGFSFLLKVFNQPSFLEDLTGLTQLHEDTQEAEVWELSDDESSIGSWKGGENL